MDLQLSESERLLRKAARDFVEKEISGLADEYERRGQPLLRTEAVQLMKKLAPLGYIGGVVPQEEGGAGLDYISHAILVEELARVWASLAMVVLNHSLGHTFMLWKEGTNEQKAKFLRPALDADVIGCMGATEPNAGSDNRSMQTVAPISGDYYIINGTKTWVSNAPIADFCTALAYTDKSKGALGLSRILVEKTESGFQSRELPKIGLRTCPTGEIVFQDCQVPRTNLLGSEGGGYEVTLGMWNFGRSSLAAMAVGIAQASLDAAVAYARDRKQFGKPIGRFQLVQKMIADMFVETQAARLLTYNAHNILDRGENCRMHSSVAKLFATGIATRVASNAMQVHGAYGLSEEYRVERYFRDAQALLAPDGTSQIQTLVVGREILGMAAFV